MSSEQQTLTNSLYTYIKIMKGATYFLNYLYNQHRMGGVLTPIRTCTPWTECPSVSSRFPSRVSASPDGPLQTFLTEF